MSNEPRYDDVVVHEFRPLPDRTPEEQVSALTAIVHQMAQVTFELRLELNDLKEANNRLKQKCLSCGNCLCTPEDLN